MISCWRVSHSPHSRASHCKGGPGAASIGSTSSFVECESNDCPQPMLVFPRGADQVDSPISCSLRCTCSGLSAAPGRARLDSPAEVWESRTPADGTSVGPFTAGENLNKTLVAVDA